MSNVPPGWYPDPEDPTRARWWDGTAWAVPPPEAAPPGVRAVGPPDAGPSAPGVTDGLRLAILGSAGLLIVAAFLPWARLSSPFLGSVSFTGIEGDGVITAGLGVVALIVAVPLFSRRPLSRPRSIGALVIGVLAAAASFTTMSNLDEVVGASHGGFGQLGIGLWLTIAAALVLTVAAVVSVSRSAQAVA